MAIAARDIEGLEIEGLGIEGLATMWAGQGLVRDFALTLLTGSQCSASSF
jgi:hypothetical protein